MLWFQVYLTEYEHFIATDKKLLVEFLKLLVQLDFPPGLAVYSETMDLQIDYFYLFSTPKEYSSQLTSLFLGSRYKEILQPDLSTLKLILGNFRD